MKYINQEPLLTEFMLGDVHLNNRIVMASMTRGRSDNPELAPTKLHAKYYAQRASAGLILTESVWVSERAIGSINLPGIYSKTQIEGWKGVTDAVHENGGKIFMQIVHSGAVSHPDFFNGALPLGPSSINPQEKCYTPSGFKDTLTPRAYTIPEIKLTIEEFKRAAVNAKEAGFDGIELHAQLFTLIPQFLSEATNQRTDQYGGSIENRSRLLFEILDALLEVFNSTQLAIKFTPAAFNHGIIRPDVNTIPTYNYLLKKLNDYKLGYIQLVRPSVELTNTPIAVLQDDFFGYFRNIYTGNIMANMGFDWNSGNAILRDNKADLVSFARPFIANPDLVRRFAEGITLAEASHETFYTGGEKGYADYPSATNIIPV
ncbi:alkene reductase [Lacibacter sediminis]|uniref:Alkene reductase n=1 Tax=Lacibacter sediminis TaxID=2760713 RepID=A0A7G5XKB0_9BACT|nr:alkene reductase [Lacibacter sediminis]QNA45913.1 alkene reductase [Lacibacter sediminis]